MGGASGQLLGQVAWWAIVLFVGALALGQIGISKQIVNVAFTLGLGAIAVAAAVETMGDCAPSRQMPAIVFHGTDDPVVLYEGGEVKYLPLRWLGDALGGPPYFLGANWVPEWAEANGCDPTPKAIPAPGDVHWVRYTGCRDGADVVSTVSSVQGTPGRGAGRSPAAWARPI